MNLRGKGVVEGLQHDDGGNGGATVHRLVQIPRNQRAVI